MAVFMAPSGFTVAATDALVYTDALAADWNNWSWDTTLNFTTTAPVHAGSKSLSVTYNAGWAGLYLHASGYDTSLYDRLSFWIHGGSVGNQRLVIVANGNSDNTYQVTAQANTWTQVIVPMSALGSPAVLTDLYWQDATGGTQPVFYLDDITLLAGSPPPSSPLSLSIDAGADRHAISEDIYGMNYADEALASDLRLPVRRWGGNATTRYNWQTSMANTASDWYFENVPEGSVNIATLPNGSASDQFVEQNLSTQTKSLLTVPMIGWTVKSTSPRQHPYDCGFKVSKYGSQQSTDASWDPDCGNGIRIGGGILTGNDPLDTSEPIGPDFVTAWIEHLIANYGTAANHGVAYYALDNEPMLWNSTHRDIHPNAVSYDELLGRTLQYAPAIKTADPTAKTLGPVVWGWCAYFYSAVDGCGIGTDYQSHSNLPFVPWYLSQLHDYERQHGIRLLDYLDLHYYPQASGVTLSAAGDSTTQALRLRSTRSLWDPDYIDESWISNTQPGGVKVQLVKRMHDWVNTYYPGTKLAITEYNWGGLESLNGALAQADVLGIFGREGLDLATLWSPPSANQPGAYAFRMFRNYDGLGHGFGDIGLQAVSSNQGNLSIYAAERSSDNALTVMVINKTGNDLTSPIDIAGLVLPSSALVYRYSAANLGAIENLPDQVVSGSGFSATYPANSITLFVLASSGANTASLTVTKTGTGSGSIAADSGALAWSGNTGTAAYNVGMPVTLTAVADAGSSFGSWSGCDSSSGTSCSVTMTSPKSVTATFTLNQYLLTVNSSGNGTGSITSSDGRINYVYPAAQSASSLFNHGATVQFTAAGSNGSTVAWSNGAGACDSIAGTADNSVCTINNMSAARTVSATFTPGTCVFSISPTSQTFYKNGGSGSITTTASSNGCSWSAVSNVAWATVSGSTFSGNATVSFSVSRNRTGSNRSGTFTIAGQTFTVTQSK